MTVEHVADAPGMDNVVTNAEEVVAPLDSPSDNKTAKENAA